MKLIYFPSNTELAVVQIRQRHFNVSVITKPVKQTITLNERLIKEKISNICLSCPKFNYRNAVNEVRDRLLTRLKNDATFFSKVKKQLVDPYYARERRFKEERDKEDKVDLLFDWCDKDKYIEEYYKKNVERCPGQSKSYYLPPEEEKQLKEEGICRQKSVSFKNIKQVDVEVPTLLWRAYFDQRGNSSRYDLYCVRQRSAVTKNTMTVAPYLLGNVYENGQICWGGSKYPVDLREAYNTFFLTEFNTDLVPSNDNSDFAPEYEENEDIYDDDGEYSYTETTTRYRYDDCYDDRYDLAEHHENFTGKEDFLVFREESFVIKEDDPDWRTSQDAIGLLVTNKLNKEEGSGTQDFIGNFSLNCGYSTIIEVKTSCSLHLAWVFKVNHKKNLALVRPLDADQDSPLKVADLNKIQESEVSLGEIRRVAEETETYYNFQEEVYPELERCLTSQDIERQLAGHCLIYGNKIHEKFDISKEDIFFSIRLLNTYKQWSLKEIEEIHKILSEDILNADANTSTDASTNSEPADASF